MEIPIQQWFWPILFRRGSRLFKVNLRRPPLQFIKPFHSQSLKHVESSEPEFVVTFTEDKQGFYINGQKFEMTSGPMLTVDIGALHHWRVMNSTREVHPFHIHQVHFLVYRVGENQLRDPVWVDTVNVPYGGSVDLVMDFTDPIIRGMSLFHCHLLKHEDKGMMAKILFR